MEVAEKVMEELGVDPERVLNVFNKCDLLPGGGWLDGGVGVSALTGAGLDDLRAEVARRLAAASPAPAVKPTDLAAPDLR
jgi:50S ribosomal subunit-associated GTPase HflX